jgi:hypothetical protein
MRWKKMRMLKRILAALYSVIIVFSGANVYVCADSATSTFTEKFDTYSGKYTESFANGRQFVTTVPNGGKTYDGVILSVPNDIGAVLKCDGNAIGFTNNEPITKSGFYTLALSASDVISGELVSDIFTFRIMGVPPSAKYNGKYGCAALSCVNGITNGENGMYKYTFPNYKAFFTTVPEYDAEVDSATFYFPVNVGYSLTKNGSAVKIENNRVISSPGNYTLTVVAKNYGVANGYELVYETALKFTIPDNTPVVAESSIGTAIGNTVTSTATQATAVYTPPESEPVSEVVKDDVIEDSLYETYNETAALYKETFSNGDSFYTNISNNGISGGNVYIDIPANMTVAMTKDGLAQAFQNKSYIKEQGTYVLKVTSNFGGEKYRARFSFRVQKGVEASNPVSENAEASMDEASEGSEDSQLDDVFSQMEQSYSGGERISNVTNTFNEERSMFSFTLGVQTFYVNMPEGMYANGQLRLDMPDGLNCTITKDGEEYPYSDILDEMGEYELTVTDLDGNSMVLTFYLYDRAVNFLDGYTAPNGYKITGVYYEDYDNTYKLDETEEEQDESDEDEETEQTEEDIAEAEAIEELKNTGRAGMRLINNLAETAATSGVSSITMPIDGRYVIELSGDNLPAMSTEILVDKTAPVVTFIGLNDKMRSTDNTVTAICDDTTASLNLYSKSGDEKLLSENGGSVQISGPNEYTLIAVDEAGNQSEYSFKIVRHIGAAGVGAIVLLLLIAAGIAGYVMFNAKKLTVR